MKKRNFYFFLLFFYIVFPADAQQEIIYREFREVTLDSMISEYLKEINSDSIENFIQGLQGMGTREALDSNRKEVAQWIQNRFISIGYENTVLDSFIFITGEDTTIQYNVIATIIGSAYPDQVYILGGHHDAVKYSPGADDNASGTAAAFEVARVFKKKGFKPEYTIRFVTFAAEEYGLHGSWNDAAKAYKQNTDIRLMINNDMIGYLSPGGDWKVRFYQYTGCEWVVDAVQDICSSFTLLQPVIYKNNSASSDSYPYWMYNYPVMYFMEEEFNPYYHTVRDSISHCNMDYCAEIVKLSCGLLLHETIKPPDVNDLEITDMGNGHTLKANWTPKSKFNITGFNVNIGTTSSTYDTSFFTPDTLFFLTNLTEGKKYYIGVTAVNTYGYESNTIENNGTPLSIPLPPEHLTDYPTLTKIKLNWDKNKENDLLGYNVYRSVEPDTSFIKINTTVIQYEQYFDNLVTAGTIYRYKITALDSPMNESQYGNSIRTTLFVMNKGILIVDDSEGGLYNPSDATVDNYYRDLLSGYNIHEYDAKKAGKISVLDIAEYSTLLWHINIKSIYEHTLFKNSHVVKSYLEAGGNILLTAFDPSNVIEENNFYPRTFYPGNFIYDYFKISDVNETGYTLFSEAIPNTSEYDTVCNDTSKVFSTFAYHMKNIEALYPAPGASVIYRFGTIYDSTTPEGQMKNEPVGIEYTGINFNVITLSFPLYYMKYDHAKNLVDYILNNKFGEKMNIPASPDNNESAKWLEIYPNPTGHYTTLKYHVAGNGWIRLSVYNSSGIEVKILKNGNQNAGHHSLTFLTEEMENGIYYCVLATDSFRDTQKLIIVH